MAGNAIDQTRLGQGSAGKGVGGAVGGIEHRVGRDLEAGAVLQHHERPDGRGFPSGIDHTRFTPLSALFVIAEDLVGALEARPSDDLRAIVHDFVESRTDYYRQGAFKKILSTIAALASLPGCVTRELTRPRRIG